MSRPGFFAFARFGASLIVCAAMTVLCWPLADATAREASPPAKRAAAAAKGKAGVAASASERRARGAKAPVVVHRKRVARSGHARASRGLQAKRGAVAAHARHADAPRTSLGHAIGLHAVDDPLSLKSAVALVVDQDTGEVLFDKNSMAVLPIASISKLMTAMVVFDGQLPLSEMLAISEADVDTERNTRSRLGTGTRLSRGELLQLALMSSENRAAHALGRHYPGGMPAFVEQMNRKAREIGMASTSFVEPTGLSSNNVSNARDLATLVRAASKYPLIREYSTSSGLTVDTGYRTVSYRNTNRLVGNPDWDIELQKTGYISEAGNCVVMQTRIDNRPVVIVLLDAQARMARVGDAQRIRQWLEHGPRTGIGIGADAHKVSAQQRAVQPSRDS